MKFSLLFEGHFPGAAEESKANPCLPRNELLMYQKKRQFHYSAAVFDISNSSVFICTGMQRNNVSIPGMDNEFFSSPKPPTRPRGPPTLLFRLSPADKAAGTWNWSCMFIFVLGWKWKKMWLDFLMWHCVHRIVLPSRPFFRVESNHCPPVRLL